MKNKPKTLDEFKNLLSSSKKIAIFGAGSFGTRIWGACQAVGCEPLCFLDNKKKDINNFKASIFSPEEYIKENPDGLIIVSLDSQKSINEARIQLQQLNFPDDQIIWLDEFIKIFEPLNFTWDNSREKEFDWSKNNDVIDFMAEWIDEHDTSVADIGCGKEMHLRKVLPTGCIYIPVDYLKRSEDTIICDFNSQNLAELSVDVVFASGILQYINDQTYFLNWVCKSAKKKIVIRFPVLEEMTSVKKFMGFSSSCSVAFVEELITKNGFYVIDKKTTVKGASETIMFCFKNNE